MKRMVLTSLLVLGMVIPFAPPAQSIFGLSACEKVRKKILAEESIGYESWKQFDDLRDKYISDTKLFNWELMELFRLVNLVHKSDLNVYAVANKNSKCFSSKLNATIRKTGAETKRSFDVIEKGIKNYDSSNSNKTNSDGYGLMNDYYNHYSSIYNKK